MSRFAAWTARRWKAALLLPWDLPPRAAMGVKLEVQAGPVLVVTGPSCMATYRQEIPRS